VAKGRTEKRAKDAGAHGKAARLDHMLLGVSIAGLVVTGILLWGDFTSGSLPYCGAGSGCDLVQQSAWSSFVGLPLAAWGFFAYASLGIVAAQKRPGRRNFWAALLGTAGFVVSVYLTAVSGIVIGTYCTYCLVSLALMSAAFALSFRRGTGRSLGPARVSGLVAAIVVAGFMHALALDIFRSEDRMDPELRQLALHLTARGMKFYGASWCPHCQQQKELFGAAGRLLPYVECSPNGSQAPRATECNTRDIHHYPTWILDERRIERVLPIDVLKSISGYTDRSGMAAPAQ
jgi:uncharacterized membrane protein